MIAGIIHLFFRNQKARIREKSQAVAEGFPIGLIFHDSGDIHAAIRFVGGNLHRAELVWESVFLIIRGAKAPPINCALDGSIVSRGCVSTRLPRFPEHMGHCVPVGTLLAIGGKGCFLKAFLANLAAVINIAIPVHAVAIAVGDGPFGAALRPYLLVEIRKHQLDFFYAFSRG